MKYQINALKTEATQIKSFIEENRKIPLACKLSTGETISPYSVAYLLSKMIKDNLQHLDYNLINVIIYNPSKRYNDTIVNEDVLKDDYLVMVQNFLKFCEKHHRVPRFVTTQKSKTKVSFELYLYCMCKIIIFLDKNNALPKYCNFNKGFVSNANTSAKTSKNSNKQSTSNSQNTTRYVSEPHYTSEGCNKLGQCTPYYCGPHSIHQAIRKFGITQYTEKQIASYAGTTTSGTGHPGINTAIAYISKKTGIKLTVTWKNFSSMGKTDAERFKAIGKLLSDKNTAVLWHICYINGGESTTGEKFGHYEVINIINTVTSYVRALNSLGTRKADGSYTGKLQDRKYNVQAYFARNTPGNQAALCIIKKG